MASRRFAGAPSAHKPTGTGQPSLTSSLLRPPPPCRCCCAEPRPKASDPAAWREVCPADAPATARCALLLCHDVGACSGPLWIDSATMPFIVVGVGGNSGGIGCCAPSGRQAADGGAGAGAGAAAAAAAGGGCIERIEKKAGSAVVAPGAAAGAAVAGAAAAAGASGAAAAGTGAESDHDQGEAGAAVAACAGACIGGGAAEVVGGASCSMTFVVGTKGLPKFGVAQASAAAAAAAAALVAPPTSAAAGASAGGSPCVSTKAGKGTKVVVGVVDLASVATHVLSVNVAARNAGMCVTNEFHHAANSGSEASLSSSPS
mmetsp:Transcript_46622/g.149786  ORF Transcript_46622/g.149786 Transcript_46622/m.149786 type:complete len:317 (+) Transcript_46622:519-1469(+)